MRTRVWRVITAILACIGALQMLVTFTPVLESWTRYLTGPAWDAPSGEVLVVLGADGPNSGELMGPASYWRSVYAVRAWRAGKFQRVLVSGGDGVAQSIANYLTAHGVPAAAVVVEGESLSTRENAQFSARALKAGNFHNIALLSSDFHMRRAAAVFRKAGVPISCIIPAPDAGTRANRRFERWSVFLTLATESAKLAWYRLAGYI